MDKIRSKMLKALNKLQLSWLIRLFNVAWRSGSTPMEWQTGVVVPIFKKGDWREGLQGNHRGTTLLSLPGKVYTEYWGGDSDQLSNLGFRRGSVAFAQIVDQWTISLPMQNY